MNTPVSVVIPVAPGETEWQDLVLSLALPAGSEIILAGDVSDKVFGDANMTRGVEISIVNHGSGRAGRMNAGAERAKNEWLWFLHADSRLAVDTLPSLANCLKSGNERLFFFDLLFRDDGPIGMRLNEWAVRIRAGFLKIPFGDQGFLLRKELFERLGGYREDVPYGEDHVFVWKAHQEGVPVSRSGGGLLTSARKYKQGGWWRVTFIHVWLTVKQGAPELFELAKRRIGR